MVQLHTISLKAIDEALALLANKWPDRKRVEHYDAETISEAVRLLNRYGEQARVIAGGVDLVSLMKNKVRLPRVLVNIKTVPGLADIREDAEGLKIGALATIHEIEAFALPGERYSLLADAAHAVAAPQIRNMATIGGNLCQDVRCWYYRRSPNTGLSFFCRRKGGERCYAVSGDNTYHAIIGGEECHAVHPSDMAPALIALGSAVRIAGPAGDKIVPLEEFYTTLGNILQPGEIITGIQVPAPKPAAKQRFLKLRPRKAIDFATCSVAAVINVESGAVTDARIVLGGVAPAPYRAVQAEEAITGRLITEHLAGIAAEASVSEAAPLTMNGYKVTMTKALVKRAILSW